jgi:hypothetical protein
MASYGIGNICPNGFSMRYREQSLNNFYHSALRASFVNFVVKNKPLWSLRSRESHQVYKLTIVFEQFGKLLFENAFFYASLTNLYP